MRRLSILPTLIVLAAVAAMIALGVWQLRRAVWKEALLARYAAAQGMPVLKSLPESARRDPESAAFRRVRLTCDEMASGGTLVQIGGRSKAGITGYRNIAACRTPTGATLMLDIGVSPPQAGFSPAWPAALDCNGFCPTKDFTGVLIPDPQLARRAIAKGGELLPLLLVAETPASGLQPSVPPSIADIPNNHRAYAVQWFLFAATALIVYVLALRRRRG